MYVCMYVCMFVCIYVCMYVRRTYVCMYVCVYVCMMYVCMYACMYVCKVFLYVLACFIMFYYVLLCFIMFFVLLQICFTISKGRLLMRHLPSMAQNCPTTSIYPETEFVSQRPGPGAWNNHPSINPFQWGRASFPNSIRKWQTVCMNLQVLWITPLSMPMMGKDKWN